MNGHRLASTEDIATDLQHSKAAVPKGLRINLNMYRPENYNIDRSKNGEGNGRRSPFRRRKRSVFNQTLVLFRAQHEAIGW